MSVDVCYPHVIAYADDAYITLSCETIRDLNDKIETSLNMHERYIECIGMVTKKDRTELIIHVKEWHQIC